MGTPPPTIDAYLAALPAAHRAALERVRRIFHAAAPGAEEGVSYGLPALRRDGRSLLWFGAAARHCAIYGVDGSLHGDLKDYDTSGRGTVRFRPDQPLPEALLRKMMAVRLARIAAPAPDP